MSRAGQRRTESRIFVCQVFVAVAETEIFGGDFELEDGAVVVVSRRVSRGEKTAAGGINRRRQVVARRFSYRGCGWRIGLVMGRMRRGSA